MTNEAIKKANRTCRKLNTTRSVTPNHIANHYYKHEKILDFGSGKWNIHVNWLRELGFENVTGYEFGDNVTENHVKPLVELYDVIYASSVFNVHSNENMTDEALKLIKKHLTIDGDFVCNLPPDPNYFWKSKKAFEAKLKEYFKYIWKGKKNLFVCSDTLKKF